MYTRLDAEAIKSSLHQALYGKDTKGNELTKFLIINCHGAKRQFLPSYKRLSDWLESQEKDVRSTSTNSDKRIINIYSVQGFYSSCAYGCMATVIAKTQSKELLFNQYLFQANREKGDILWESLIDTKTEIKFEVETSFKVKEVSPILRLFASSQAVAETFDKYFSASLFIEDHSVKAIPAPAEKKEEAVQEKGTVFEQDRINTQLVMVYILRLIETMEGKFGKEWESQGEVMPQFMQALKHELTRPDTNVNIKIFILKIVVNKAALFKRFAKDWFEPIMAYVIGGKKQGKGFHYFSRDLCTTILEWNYVPPRTNKTIELCSSLVDSIVRVLPDQTSYIFHMNVRVLGTLMERFSKLIYINKDLLTNMIGVAKRTDSIDLWRLNAMQVLAFASANDIPLCESYDKYISLPTPSFQLPETDILYRKLLENLTYHKRSVDFAAADTLGRIHGKLKSPLHDSTLGNYVIGVVLPKGMAVLAQICERIMAGYPQLLNERKLFLKVLAMVSNLSGVMRASVLTALNYYLPVARVSGKQADIEEICGTLQANGTGLSMDNILEHRKAFLGLLSGLTQVRLDAAQLLFTSIVPLLTTDIYINNPDEEIRFMICQLMCWVYDNVPSASSHARVCIVESFADKSERVQKYLRNMWDSEQRLTNSAAKRLVAIMKSLYVREGPYQNRNWIEMSLSLLISLSKRSADYDKKIYEYPLSKCPFSKLDVGRNNLLLNRSQPLTLMVSSLSDEPGVPKAVGSRKSDSSVQGIRTTQAAIFSPSLEQSLVVGKDNKFGDSFFQTDDKHRDEAGSQEEVKSGKDEKFKVPEAVPAKKGKRHTLSLFSSGNFAYGPQLVNGRIRYKPLGVIVNKDEEIRKSEKDKAWRARTQQSPISTCREYRVGELPDIEILYKDIIEPLRILALKDSSIASELFVSLFSGIYFTECSQGLREEITHYLGELLELQQRHSASYQTIYVLHQIMINLLKGNVYFSLSEMQFAHTEQSALNFQTSILAIEESILSIQQRPLPAVKRPKLPVPKQKTNPRLAPGLTVYNSRLWLQLARMHKQVNNFDYTNGIYSIIAEDAHVFTTEMPQEDIVDLVGKALEERIDLKHSRCVNTTTRILSMVGVEYSVDKELLDSLRKDKYESLERLGKWEELENDIIKVRSEAIWQPENRDELFTLIRARIRCETTWGRLQSDLKVWMKDESKKGIMINQFSYEMALCSIIQQDLDRAAYYIDRELTRVQQRWNSINSMSFGTMHYLVQSLQKIHEFYEFLKVLKNDQMQSKEELLEEVIALCHKWKDRKANVHFDSMKTWDDILYSRGLFLDILSVKFRELKGRLNEEEETKDLLAQFYIQTAHAAYKKKMFECTDSYLRAALKHRSDPSNTSLVLTYPIIKLKAKQHRIEGAFMEPSDRISKYLKIIEIADAENKKVDGGSVQLSLLSFRLSQIVAKEYVVGGWLDDYTKCLQSCFEFMHSAEKASNASNRAKVHFHYALFCDDILRQINSKFKDSIITNLRAIDIDQVGLAATLIKNGLLAISLRHRKGNNLVPRILDILSQMCGHLVIEDIFTCYSAMTPAWMFLPWINQLIAIMNGPAARVISAKFEEIAEKYQQPLIYALKVADSNRKVDDKLNTGEVSELYRRAIELVDGNRCMNAWMEALDGLTYPEHRTRYWLELMRKAFESDDSKDSRKLHYLIGLCHEDVFAPTK